MFQLLQIIRSFLFIVVFITLTMIFHQITPVYAAEHPTFWHIQSIDTMKFSRDRAREYSSDLSAAFEIINTQVEAIASTGATHVAIGTPYDEEFLPVMHLWVEAARSNNINVWFRGNWSGWEKWFGYQGITRSEHLAKTKDFILQNPELFADGDIFSACPECENGGPGDPRQNQDVIGHRQFLIDEFEMTSAAFATINKTIINNAFSMNGDVARLIMDQPTTHQLGGVVTVDHYVTSPQQLVLDLENIASKSGGQIILGEFGAPIPDLHGKMTQQQQAEWLQEVMKGLAKSEVVIGMNYWTNQDGSTALWSNTSVPTPAVDVITSFYRPPTIAGKVLDLNGKPVHGAQVTVSDTITSFTDKEGNFQLAYFEDAPVKVTALNFQEYSTNINTLQKEPSIIQLEYLPHVYSTSAVKSTIQTLIFWMQHYILRKS